MQELETNRELYEWARWVILARVHFLVVVVETM